jgi:hypothetical protein
MTDDQKAVALVKEVQAERAHTGNPWNSPTILSEALYRAVGLRAPICGNERIDALRKREAVCWDMSEVFLHAKDAHGLHDMGVEIQGIQWAIRELEGLLLK